MIKHYFSIGDRVRLTKKRLAKVGYDLTYPSTGVVVKIELASCFLDRLFISVDHGVPSYTDVKWIPKSLELDDIHRKPCACFECAP